MDKINSFDRIVLLEDLGAIRSELIAWLEQLPDQLWKRHVYTSPETWTVADTVRHLIQAEKSMVRLMEGIRQGGPGAPAGLDLAAFNRRGIELIGDRKPAELLQDLGAVRAGTQAFVERLADSDWEKKGRHGSGRVMSIREICWLISTHEAGHLADIRRVTGG